MKDSDKLFFKILRKGLWGKSENDIYCSVDEQVWREVLWLSSSQTVAGIIADGLSDCTQGVVPHQVAMKLISASVSTEHRNQQMNSKIAQIIPEFMKSDIPVVVVKGQSIAQHYKKPSDGTPLNPTSTNYPSIS